MCVGPAALAAAEGADASGRELLEAGIVGFEVVSRLGRSAGGDRGDHYERGFHGTSVFGVFGATAAACRVMGLDADAARNAFGIAASAAKGVRANYGTMTKPLHAGEASRAGVMAALLAAEGFTEAKLRELAPYRSRIRVHALEGRPDVTVSAWTRDGRWLSAVEPGNYFDDSKGAPALSLSDLSDEELRQKFRDNLKIVNRTHTADALLEELDHLDRSSSLRGLTDLLL